MKKQKENSHEGITWSEMGKQNVQAEKVYCQKPSLVSNTVLRYSLISEQILVQQMQASWYTESRAITLLEHLLPQHGTIQGAFVKIWEPTLL